MRLKNAYAGAGCRAASTQPRPGMDSDADEAPASAQPTVNSSTRLVHSSAAFALSHSSLLTEDMDTPQESKTETESLIESTDKAEKRHTSPWTPGAWERLPSVGLLALLGAIIAAIGMASIVVYSNGKPIDLWYTQPSVLLAIASTAANILIRFALSEGVTIAWWVRSLRHGTRVADLHQTWAQGTSLKSAVFAGRARNLAGFASILVAFTPINNPLLQRALTVGTAEVSGPSRLSIAAASEVPPSFTGAWTSGGGTINLLTSDFSKIVQDYSVQAPLSMKSHGGSCPGLCSGLLKATGYTVNCSSQGIPFHLNWTQIANASMQSISQVSSDMEPITLSSGSQLVSKRDPSVESINTVFFSTNFTYVNGSSPRLALSTLYKSGNACDGDLNSTKCMLTPALMEYHVQFDSKSIWLDPNHSYKDDRTVQIVSKADESESTYGGMALALNSLYNSESSVDVTNGGSETTIKSVHSSGPLTLKYAPTMALKTDSTANCTMKWGSPTGDLLDAARQLAFRIAITAADPKSATNLQTITVNTTQTVSVYRAHFLYLGLALAFTLCSPLCVFPLFVGWGYLGRPISLSPIEVAKAFDAPILCNSDSNAKIETLLDQVGSRRVQYGAVAEGNNKGALVMGTPASIRHLYRTTEDVEGEEENG